MKILKEKNALSLTETQDKAHYSFFQDRTLILAQHNSIETALAPKDSSCGYLDSKSSMLEVTDNTGIPNNSYKRNPAKNRI